MFSVVIPLYNKAYSLNRCVDSVLSQSMREFEIVVVDDGSTDGSLELLKANYSKEINHGLVTVVEKRNGGVASARNKGISVAKSELICLLDADDEWKPGYLKAMAELVSDYPLALVYALAHTVVKKYSIEVEAVHGLDQQFRGYVENFLDASSKGSVLNSSKVCVRRSAIVEVGGFPEEAVAGEDLLVWILLSQKGRVACDMKYLAVVHHQADVSRARRHNSVPYPLIYFGSNRDIKRSPNLDRYLWRIFYKHFLSSALSLRLREALLRLYWFLKMYI